MISLGAGIGATAVVFTWLERFAITPVPMVPNQDRLFRVVTARNDGSEAIPD